MACPRPDFQADFFNNVAAVAIVLIFAKVVAHRMHNGNRTHAYPLRSTCSPSFDSRNGCGDICISRPPRCSFDWPTYSHRRWPVALSGSRRASCYRRRDQCIDDVWPCCERMTMNAADARSASAAPVR